MHVLEKEVVNYYIFTKKPIWKKTKNDWLCSTWWQTPHASTEDQRIFQSTNGVYEVGTEQNRITKVEEVFEIF